MQFVMTPFGNAMISRCLSLSIALNKFITVAGTVYWVIHVQIRVYAHRVAFVGNRRVEPVRQYLGPTLVRAQRDIKVGGV